MIGHMGAAAGEAGGEPAVDGPECQAPAVTGALEQPLELGGGKVGIEYQAGGLPDLPLPARCFQFGTAARGSPVLPDDGPADRGQGTPVPENHGFPLVGNANADGNLACL